MTPLAATLASIGGVVVSVITALATLSKTLADRRHGIGEHELATSRFGLESMQASIAVKDAIIVQLREQLEESRQEVRELKVQIEDLQTEVELLKEASGRSATP